MNEPFLAKATICEADFSASFSWFIFGLASLVAVVCRFGYLLEDGVKWGIDRPYDINLWRVQIRALKIQSFNS